MRVVNSVIGLRIEISNYNVALYKIKLVGTWMERKETWKEVGRTKRKALSEPDYIRKYLRSYADKSINCEQDKIMHIIKEAYDSNGMSLGNGGMRS